MFAAVHPYSNRRVAAILPSDYRMMIHLVQEAWSQTHQRKKGSSVRAIRAFSEASNAIGENIAFDHKTYMSGILLPHFGQSEQKMNPSCVDVSEAKLPALDASPSYSHWGGYPATLAALDGFTEEH